MRVLVLVVGLAGCDRMFNLLPLSSNSDGGGDSLANDGDSDAISDDGSSPDSPPVMNLAVGVAAGDARSCAFSQGGVLHCWGEGADGRLGGGTNTNRIGDDELPSTVPAVAVGGSVVGVGAGDAHTCALLNTGAVRCWGLGLGGRLGYANTDSIGDNEDPSTAGSVSVGGALLQIAVGGQHTCARTIGSTVVCWGVATNGRLGYGNTNPIGDTETPASIGAVPVGATVLQVAAGGAHTCVVTGTNAVRCWGAGSNGRLGYNSTLDVGDASAPSSVGDVVVGGSVTQVAAGRAHTCALLSTGAVRCWGAGASGALGYGNVNDIGDGETPASAGDVSLGATAIQITAGGDHTCALLADNTVRCWGANTYGQLGYGTINAVGASNVPSSAGPVALGGVVIEVRAGVDHTCAVMETGAVRCWGRGFDGRLGYGNANTIGDNEPPAGDVSVF